MKNKLIIILYWVGLLFITPCQAQRSPQSALQEDDKILLQSVLNQIAEDDQKYRLYISIGTTDDVVVTHFRKVTDTMSIEQYLAYERTLDYSLTKEVKEELWIHQHKSDLINYKKLKSIIRTFGYPSKERVGSDKDVFPIFLHPPVELDPQEYLDEMSGMLRPEVKAGRLSAKKYAMFYDNIKAKILDEPQLYGTNTPFNMETMKAGLPPIADINTTNKARKRIGLEALEEGEYQLVDSSR